MNKDLVTIVALSVDTRHAVLYMQDGSTMTIPQGDARLPRIVSESKQLLAHNLPATVDVAPIVPQRTEFSDAEKGTKGVVKFFKVAKSFLKKLVNTESPDVVPAEVAHVTPLDIGVFPGRDVPNQGTKEESEAPQEDLDAAIAAAQNATTRPSPVPLTNDQKLDAAKDRMLQLVGNSVGTQDAKFHTPLKEDETIVAVHATSGAIIPDAHKLARQLRSSQKLENYQGFQRFIERLAAIIDHRGHSVEDLMKFIEHGDLPIADDGSIVIYKRLNRLGGETFVDVHTGRIKQKVGSFVFMEAGLVDPNRRKDCSNGLHVGSLGYMSSFSGDVTAMCKVRPEDVFAVPEYAHTKMRVSGYHVLVDLPAKLKAIVNNGGSISSDPEGALLLAQVLRGEHIGITQYVQVGGDQGTNVTYTDVEGATGPQVEAQTLTKAETLDMQEVLEAKAPVAPEIKAADLVSAPVAEEDEDTVHCDSCGDVMDDGEGYDGLCGDCADQNEAADGSSIILIMSNTPQDTLVEADEKPKKLSQREQVKTLLDEINQVDDPAERASRAQKLIAFKKSARKSWEALGMPLNLGDVLNKVIDAKATPVNAPKPVKAELEMTSGMKELRVEQALALLKAGHANSEVASKTGLSKDQVYRLKKKLQN